MSKNKVFLSGMRDGFPIGMGYFAVAFSLGIIAKKAGLLPIQAFISSLFVRASAGEYIGYTLIMEKAAYIEVALMCVITNLRYLLMSTALSQKLKPGTSLAKRILTGICVTDEIFGIGIAYKGYLDPMYTLGATAVAGPMWALGDSLGIIAGSVLPARIVSALSVALYGMFLAVIIPPAKKDKCVCVAVIAAFLLSYIAGIVPVAAALSSGTRTILLTVIISAAAALIRPVSEVADNE